MGIKLVALDLDGTTLRSDLTVADHTRKTIKKAVDQGVIIVPTTGRAFHELPKDITNIAGITYAITSNGAQVTELKTQKTLYANSLSGEDLNQVLAVLNPFDLMIEAYIEGRSVVMKQCMDHMEEYNVPREYWPFFRSTRVAIAEKNGYFDYLHSHSVEKFNVFFKNIEDRLRLELALKEQTKMTITSAVENNLEINNPTANKKDGLDHLCQVLKVSHQDIMAMGDSNNDCEMLKYAGFAVAMKNGIDRVKEISDYVTKNNDDHGVAYALEKFVLNAS
ncbi:MAG: Cof-type HAD-IIB family hydrolase [Eubacterium sp.]